MKTDWIEITKDNLPPHLLVCEWKHPEYGVIKGNIVVYQPERGQHKETWWIYPDPDCEEGSQADIALSEFTYYRKIIPSVEEYIGKLNTSKQKQAAIQKEMARLYSDLDIEKNNEERIMNRFSKHYPEQAITF